jgi:hypothetical protein
VLERMESSFRTEGVSVKRLSFAAFISTSVVLLTTLTPAEAAPMPKMIASSARGVASSMSSVGYCFRGVKRALKRVGIVLTGSDAYMAKSQLATDERFQRVSLDNLKTGDILVHGASAAHPHGHIAVYLGDGREASDHIGRLITGRRYGGTTVWRVRDNAQIAQAAPQPEPTAVVAQAAAPVAEAPVVEAPLAEAPAAGAPAVEAAVASPVVLDLTAQAAPTEAPQVIASAMPTNWSNAFMQMLQMAQSAQINLAQALQDAVDAAI